jgi:ubiquinone/menaquinone biosynthesis C-methylase UbiE
MKDINAENKKQITSLFDTLAPDRLKWKKRNWFYYHEQERYLRFLVPEGSSVLEVGCGTGDLLNSLRPDRGVGIDISSEILKIAVRQYPDLEFRQMDAEQMEPWGEQFDFIVLSDVIGLLPDIQKGLEQLRPFCRPETRVIISFHNFLWEPVLRLGERTGLKMPQKCQNWLSSSDIINLLSLSGYEAVKSEYDLLLPRYIPLLSTFFNRCIARLPGINGLCLSQYIVARPIGLRDKRDYSVTIVVPCKNEKNNVEPAVRRIPEFGTHQEILFVEGGSTDNTREEIERVIKAYPDKDIKLFLQDGKGKGDAVRKGFSNATGDILMILDADLTMPPEDLTKFYYAISDDMGEFINGCRLIYPMEKEAMRFLNMLGNKFFSSVFTWLLNQRIKDTLCGTKVISAQNYRKIAANRGYFGEFDPFGDFDLLFGASKLSLRIIEIPIRYKTREYGETQISRFRHGLLLLRMSYFAMRKLKR